MAPVGESAYESKEFMVVDVIILLSIRKGFGVISHSDMFVSTVHLCEYSTGGIS